MQRGGQRSNETLKLVFGGTTAIAAVVAAIGTMRTAEAVKSEARSHSRAAQMSSLYKEYASVGKCMSEIGYFYQDRQRRKDDADKKPLNERLRPDRESIAKDWAHEKRSVGQKLSEEVRAVDHCRQVTTNFFKNAYMLLDKGLIDKDVFEESFYARSGNFKRLVEPLDKANFDLVNQNPKQIYKDGNNRPAIYVRIEQGEKDPALQQYF